MTTGADNPPAKCALCGETFPPGHGPQEILDHLRRFHPTEYGDGPEHWPDGGLVVVDLTDLEGVEE